MFIVNIVSKATSTFSIMHLICPLKFYITFVFSFLLGITAVPREIENNADANFGGQIRCVMGNVEVADWPFRDCEETGLMWCRIALWDCFGDAISFFNGCHEVARQTGSKFVANRSFLNNVTAAMLVYQNNEKTATYL